MKDLVSAIVLAGLAIGVITFMSVVGTLLAPLAVMAAVVAFFYMIIQDNKEED